MKLIQIIKDFSHLHFKKPIEYEYTDLRDLLIASLFLEYFGLDNPLGIYTMDIYPYLLEEFHNWHKTLGFERSPISSFLIFGGKGGVGKSTLACAVAIKLSEKGN